MIADGPRMEAYDAALRRAVRPHSVVFDIGTGTGMFAVLACRYGARRVYAIEPDDAIQVARETAVVNGCADRIEFIQRLSTEFAPAERADVIVSDLRGVLPMFQHHIPSIIDARTRLLAPNGMLVPSRDTLWVAVVSARQIYERHVMPWGANTRGVDMEASRRIVSNTWRKHRFEPDQILLPPQAWMVLDYSKITQSDVAAEVGWTVERAGVAHGFAAWFDAELSEGIGFTNAPGHPELIYGNAFFPWSHPVDLEVGDTVSLRLHANLVGDDYIWRWSVRVLRQGRPDCIKADFRQSSLQGVPLSPERLRAQSSSYVPKLGEDGRIDKDIMGLFDGQRSLEAIARDMAARFPHRFRDWRDALTRAGELAQRYGEKR
jgi:protein arginine N-methyltransferase 1